MMCRKTGLCFSSSSSVERWQSRMTRCWYGDAGRPSCRYQETHSPPFGWGSGLLLAGVQQAETAKKTVRDCRHWISLVVDHIYRCDRLDFCRLSPMVDGGCTLDIGLGKRVVDRSPALSPALSPKWPKLCPTCRAASRILIRYRQPQLLIKAHKLRYITLALLAWEERRFSPLSCNFTANTTLIKCLYDEAITTNCPLPMTF